MEKETNNNSEQQGSQFCDTLMNVTGAVGHLRRNGDAAIVICKNEKTVSCRKCGTYKDNLDMVVVKMENDVDFAELIVEAGIVYSRWLQTKGAESVDEENDENKGLINFS